MKYAYLMLFVWVVLAVASAAGAATLNVPSEFATIQAGIDAAALGDTVLVAPGTYSDFETRELQAGGLFTASAIVFMRSGVAVVSEAGSDVTTLDMAGQGDGDQVRCVLAFVQEGGPMLLQGFRITGVPTGHAGMACSRSDPVVLRDCVFDSLDGAAGELPGGLLAISTATVSLFDCRFTDCVGANGPNLTGGLRASDTSILVVDCTFQRCSGGASYSGSNSSGPSAVFRRCRFLDNFGNQGVGIRAGGPQVTIVECWFEGNSGASGAAADAIGVANLLVEDNVVLNNSADVAGGMLFTNCVGTVQNNTFHANAASVPLGGANLRLHGGETNAEVHNNIFSGARGDQSVSVTSGTVVSCNVFWDNPLGDANSSYPWDPTDRIQDPQFCVPDTGDLSLRATSPCLPANSLGCDLIGALGQGCGSVSVTPSSWGRLKALYRDGRGGGQ